MGASKERQRQILASIPVSFNEFVLGIGFGWVAPTLRLLRTAEQDGALSLTDDQASWIASLHDVGRFFGPVLVPALMNRVGRRGTLATSSILSFISYALIALSKSIPAVYAGRLIFGFSNAAHVVAASVYLCENLKSTNRGAFAAVSIACFYGGSMIEFALANFFTYETTAYINAAVAFLALSPVLLSVETAEHLMTERKYEKAFDNFLWLRGKKVATEDEFSEFEKLKQFVDEEGAQGQGLRSVLSNPVNRKAIATLVFLSILIGATGFDPVMSYVSITFTRGLLEPNEYTVVFGTLQFAAAVLGSVAIERMNRRTILSVALLIAAMVHAATAVLFFLLKIGVVEEDAYFSLWTFVTITAYSMAFSFGTLPSLVIIRGELFSQAIRSVGSTAGYMAFAFTGFVTAKIFLWVERYFGVLWNFVLYSVMSVASVMFIRFVLPETGGKSAMEIQRSIEMRIRRK